MENLRSKGERTILLNPRSYFMQSLPVFALTVLLHIVAEEPVEPGAGVEDPCRSCRCPEKVRSSSCSCSTHTSLVVSTLLLTLLSTVLVGAVL